METTTEKTQSKWVLDPVHSELSFKVRHLMITNVKGEFGKFTIDVEGEDITTSSVKVHVESASITTNDSDRDQHLKSADFFDVENHKELTFKSTSFTQKNGDEYELKGILTIKDISKEVVLEVENGGINTDPWGNQKAGFSFNGKINREDWDLKWNTALETGGVLVSNDVKISGEVQFVKQS